MEVSHLWNDQIPEKDGEKQSVNDVAFSPDGSRIVAAVGSRVLLYRAADGNLIESLKGHKETVYCVDFSGDGTRFASGGADNVVIIWKSTGQGLLKYNHSASIQQVKYNPNMILLASCSETDFGLWSPDQKQVTKEKMPSKILSCAWSIDGTLLALGMMNGVISIRNQQAEEILTIEKKAPIWCLAFIPEQLAPATTSSVNNANNNNGAANNAFTALLEHADNLAIGCWDKTYSLYRFTPQRTAVLLNEKNLSYYPCSMSCANNPMMKSCYLVVSGSNKQVQVLSREGVKLAEILKDPADSWVWSSAVNAEEDLVVHATHHGQISLTKINFDSVHALYKDRYAFRENLTEVIIHHLQTDKKVRIKCKDMIHNLSLYKNKLAVQLFDRICIYESSAEDFLDIHFRLRRERVILANIGSEKNRLAKQVANTLVICSNHFLSAVGNALELFAFDGSRLKIWMFDAIINCLKVDGGVDNREGVLVGLNNGAVMKVFIDNPFPIEVLKRATAILKVDVNLYRTLIATIDTAGTLIVSDLSTLETLFTLAQVKNAVFNSEVEDLLCITNLNNTIAVVSGLVCSSAGANIISQQENSDLDRYYSSYYGGAAGRVNAPEVQEQHINGIAVGFKGQKIFCLNKGQLTGVDVPQSMNIMRSLESNDFASAYHLCCLGATEADYRLLAMKALRANYLYIAKQCFGRLKDTKYLNLIEMIEQANIANNAAANMLLASNNSAANASAGAGRPGRLGLNNKANEIKAKAQVGNALVPGAANTNALLDFRWQAEILAYEGHYHEAAKIYARNNKVTEAIRLFVDIRRFEEAKTFARSLLNSNNSNANNNVAVDINALTQQQAKWLQEIRDWKAAAELHCSLNQYNQAARIIAEYINADSPATSANNTANTSKLWPQAMIEVVRQCPAEDKETLLFCGEKLAQLDDISLAKETFNKANDFSQLMQLYIQREMWNEAAQLADEHPNKFEKSVFLKYAHYLISADKYEEAMEAFKKCQRLDLSRQVLMQLTNNAVVECRFKDAAYYYWCLAKEVELEANNLLNNNNSNTNHTNNNSYNSISSCNNNVNQLVHRLALQQSEYEHKADLYYAYYNVHSYVTDPFTSLQPEMLFQVSRFILNSLGNNNDVIPAGISKTAALYTLAKQSMLLSAFKLAREVYEKLSKQHITHISYKITSEDIELDMLLVQAKPLRDDHDHLPVCYRCGSTNPLLNNFNNRFNKGDVCVNCGHPFVRSFINFDVLPLVEFVPEPAISDEEAIDLIKQPPHSRHSNFNSSFSLNSGKRRGEEKSEHGGRVNILSLQDDEEPQDHFNQQQQRFKMPARSMMDDDQELDYFTHCLNLTLEKQKGAYIPVQVDANTLLSMKRSDVFVCKPSSKNKRATFYKNMLPEIPIAISQPCHRFFHLEDFEFAYLSEKRCPYSRLRNVGEYGSI